MMIKHLLLLFLIAAPSFAVEYSADIKARAEHSYESCPDKNFNLTLIENRWINNTKHTILWATPRSNDNCWNGFYNYNIETGISTIVCRIDISKQEQEECVRHELCHKRQYAEYYVNPPRNQLWLSERYMREQQWEEECYAEAR